MGPGPWPALLQELSPYRDCVVSTGGGVVTLAANWGQMQSGVVVWLCGTPELLASRVLADGAASRPLLEQVRGRRRGGGTMLSAVQ